MTEQNYSVAELEKILDERKAQLMTLGKRREGLQAELEKVNDEILALMGEGGKMPRRTRRRRRPENEKSLRAVVLDILGKNKKGFTLSDLAAKVEATGYKSNSRNFKNVLYQCVYNTPGIGHVAETGCYALV